MYYQTPLFETLENRLLLSAGIAATVPVVATAAAPVVVQQQTPNVLANFNFYDAMVFTNKPDLAAKGVKPIVMKYWSNVTPANYDALMTQQYLTDTAKSIAPGSLVCFDLPGLSTTSWDDAVITDSINKLIRVADIVHAANPTLKIGFFGALPTTELYYGVYASGPGSPADVRWREVNAKLQSLAQHVDVIFPELYAMYHKTTDWVKSSTLMLQEAHKYGKPVVPFISPAYSSYVYKRPDMAFMDLPRVYWQAMLNTVTRQADSAVIWGGWNGACVPWNPSAPWVTDLFTTMKKIGITTAAPLKVPLAA